MGSNRTDEPIQINVRDRLSGSIPVGAGYRQHQVTLPQGTRITDCFPGGEKSEWFLVNVWANKNGTRDSLRERIRLT